MKTRGIMQLRLLTACLLLVATGCGNDEPAQPPTKTPSPDASVALPPPPAPPASAAVENERAAAKKIRPSAAETPVAESGPTAVKPPETILEAADIGSGAKGHYNNEGLYTTPVSVFFRVQDRIAFQIQVPHALQLFKAINNRAPKDHEEFMQKIIRENQIRLPDLPEGHSYVYDPETEQLMVRRPAPRPIPGISESK